jgi:B-box zinc finger
MICSRCGVVNRAGRVACVQCMARLDPASAPSEPPHCQDHPNVPATGRCVACSKFVCDQCGGVINNRAVYCIDHAAMAMAGVTAATPAPKAKRGRGKSAEAA